jgi:hypothetical protein
MSRRQKGLGGWGRGSGHATLRGALVLSDQPRLPSDSATAVPIQLVGRAVLQAGSLLWWLPAGLSGPALGSGVCYSADIRPGHGVGP